jgi:hypothetical protein
MQLPGLLSWHQGQRVHYRNCSCPQQLHFCRCAISCILPRISNEIAEIKIAQITPTRVDIALMLFIMLVALRHGIRPPEAVVFSW